MIGSSLLDSMSTTLPAAIIARDLVQLPSLRYCYYCLPPTAIIVSTVADSPVWVPEMVSLLVRPHVCIR